MTTQNVEPTKATESGLAEFKGFTVGHKHLIEARNKLLSVVREPGDASLVIIFGPSGVGKTTMLKSVMKNVAVHEEQRMKDDPGYVPITYIENPSPERGVFDWKDFYIRSLQSLDEPLIDFKIDPHEQFELRKRELSRKRSEISALRRSLENALYYRHVQATLIDEAQHFAKVASSKRMIDQLDALKSIANHSRSLLVLAGTYELLPFTTSSGQLSRRSILIHLPRYRVDVEEERDAFLRALLAFQQKLPLPEQPDLLRRWDYLYTYSAGCVGILKNWLNRALEAAVYEGRPTVTDAVLRRTAMSRAQCMKLAEEIHENERLARNMMEARNDEDLKRMLGFPDMDVVQDDQHQQQSQSHRKSSRKPGQRKTTRDPIGVPNSLRPAESM